MKNIIGINVSPDSIIFFNNGEKLINKVKVSNPLTTEDISNMSKYIEENKECLYAIKHGTEKGKFKSSPNTFRIEGVLLSILKGKLTIFSPITITKIEKDNILDIDNEVKNNNIKKVNYKSFLASYSLILKLKSEN